MKSKITLIKVVKSFMWGNIFLLASCSSESLQPPVSELIAKANQGDSSYQERLGDMYFQKRNFEAALEWYIKAKTSPEIQSRVQKKIDLVEKEIIRKKNEGDFFGIIGLVILGGIVYYQFKK